MCLFACVLSCLLLLGVVHVLTLIVCRCFVLVLLLFVVVLFILVLFVCLLACLIVFEGNYPF